MRFLTGPSVLVLLLVSIGGCAGGRSGSDSEPTSSPAKQAREAGFFTEITESTGLDSYRHETGAFGRKWMPETVGPGGGFIDYNDDGRLDIVLVGGGAWEPSPETDVQGLYLYRNEGNGSFTEVTDEAGLGGVEAYGMGIAAADVDNDGDQDLLLTTLGRNRFFLNKGGRFVEATERSGIRVEPSRWSTSALFFDANRDGWVDLYVANYLDWSPEKDRRCTLDGKTNEYCTPDLYEGVAARFFVNQGDGTFAERTREAGFSTQTGNSLGVDALDFNADGWTDLVVANDMERNLLYRNQGDGRFEEVGRLSGVAYGEAGTARAGMGVDATRLSRTDKTAIAVGNFANEMIGLFTHDGGGIFIDQADARGLAGPTLRTLTFGLFFFDADLDGDQDLFAANGHIKPGLERIQNEIRYRQRPQLFLQRSGGRFDWLRPEEGPLTRRMVARGAAYGDVDGDGDLDLLIVENGGPAHLWRNDGASGRYLRVDLAGRDSPREGIGARVEVLADGRRMGRLVGTGGSYLSQSELMLTFGLGEMRTADSLVVYWPSGTVDRFADVPGGRTVRIEEGVGLARSRGSPGRADLGSPQTEMPSLPAGSTSVDSNGS